MLDRRFRRHALAMLAEADAAVEAVEFAAREPRGLIRPVALSRSPRRQWHSSYRPSLRIIPIFGWCWSDESACRRDQRGFDVALRVRTTPTGEDGLVMRTSGEARHLLVATGAYLEQRGRPERPEQLAQHATLSFETGTTVKHGSCGTPTQLRRGSSIRRDSSVTISPCCAPRCWPASALRYCRRAWYGQTSRAAASSRFSCLGRCRSACFMSYSDAPRSAALGAGLH